MPLSTAAHVHASVGGTANATHDVTMSTLASHSSNSQGRGSSRTAMAWSIVPLRPYATICPRSLIAAAEKIDQPAATTRSERFPYFPASHSMPSPTTWRDELSAVQPYICIGVDNEPLLGRLR